MKCTSWRPLERGSLQGFADLELANGMVLHGVTLHRQNGKAWCGAPSRPQLNAGRELVVENGKVLYSPAVSFVDAKTRSAWSTQAVAAIAEYQSKAPLESGAMNGADTSGGQPQESKGW